MRPVEDPALHEQAEREVRFGDAWDVPEEDPRLGWGVIVDLAGGGVAMWGVSWSVEASLRTTHRLLREKEQASPDVDTWMTMVNERWSFKDTFPQVIHGARVMSGSYEGVLSTSEALQFLNACQDQAMARLGLERPLWPATLVLRAHERPETRFNTIFIDDALVQRLAEHVRVAAEQRMLRRALDSRTTNVSPIDDRSVVRPRL